MCMIYLGFDPLAVNVSLLIFKYSILFMVDLMILMDLVSFIAHIELNC